MNIFFEASSVQEVCDKIQECLNGRKLGDLVSLEAKGSELVVKISKAGTSTLTFASSANDGGLQFNKTGEKIALTHRMFKDEVTSKFQQVVENAGGKVV